jgi:hypothetical protein
LITFTLLSVSPGEFIKVVKVGTPRGSNKLMIQVMSANAHFTLSLPCDSVLPPAPFPSLWQNEILQTTASHHVDKFSISRKLLENLEAWRSPGVSRPHPLCSDPGTCSTKETADWLPWKLELPGEGVRELWKLETGIFQALQVNGLCVKRNR